MKQTTFCAILLLATGCTSPKKAHTADPLRVGTIVVTPSSDIDAALYVGTIEEETSAALSFPVAGTLAHLRGRRAARAAGTVAGRARPDVGPADLRCRAGGARPGERCLRAPQTALRRRKPARDQVGRGTDPTAPGRVGIRHRPQKPRRLQVVRALHGRHRQTAGRSGGDGSAGRPGHDPAADRDGESPLPGTRAGDRTPGHGQPAADNRRGTRRPGIPGREDRKGCRGKPRHTYL